MEGRAVGSDHPPSWQDWRHIHPTRMRWSSIRTVQLGPDIQVELGRYVGLIRCFNSEVGHGFIACPELKGLGYQNDVFVHHLQIGTFGQGDEVSFDAYLNARGQPQSKDLASAEGQLADFKKQLEEEFWSQVTVDKNNEMRGGRGPRRHSAEGREERRRQERPMEGWNRAVQLGCRGLQMD